MRILSLNMLHGHPRFVDLTSRLDLIATEITRLGADIIMLQEVPWTLQHGNAAAWLAEQTGMNYLYLRANGGRWTIFFEEGEAILSR
jgi:endonuclease/exonuclease/phosphatase family metal-dependent hydrolase